MGPRPRTLLVCSLTALLFLVAVTGFAAFVVVGRIQSGEAELRARSLERVRSLEQLRDAIYLSGTDGVPARMASKRLPRGSV